MKKSFIFSFLMLVRHDFSENFKRRHEYKKFGLHWLKQSNWKALMIEAAFHPDARK